MTDIPKNLLDLASDAVYGEEAGERDGWGVDVDMRHAPLIAAAALRPALDELRERVEAMSADSPETRSFRARVLALIGDSNG